MLTSNQVSFWTPKNPRIFRFSDRASFSVAGQITPVRAIVQASPSWCCARFAAGRTHDRCILRLPNLAAPLFNSLFFGGSRQ